MKTSTPLTMGVLLASQKAYNSRLRKSYGSWESILQLFARAN